MENTKTIHELEFRINSSKKELNKMQRFLKYLNSSKRKKSILNKENLSQIHHCDVENFKAL